MLRVSIKLSLETAFEDLLAKIPDAESREHFLTAAQHYVEGLYWGRVNNRELTDEQLDRILLEAIRDTHKAFATLLISHPDWWH